MHLCIENLVLMLSILMTSLDLPDRTFKAFDELKHLLISSGIEESSHKAVPPSNRI